MARSGLPVQRSASARQTSGEVHAFERPERPGGQSPPEAQVSKRYVKGNAIRASALGRGKRGHVACKRSGGILAAVHSMPSGTVGLMRGGAFEVTCRTTWLPNRSKPGRSCEAALSDSLACTAGSARHLGARCTLNAAGSSVMCRISMQVRRWLLLPRRVLCWAQCCSTEPAAAQVHMQPPCLRARILTAVAYELCA